MGLPGNRPAPCGCGGTVVAAAQGCSVSGECVERIVSHGHCSPDGFWYDQGQYECVLVIQGAARIEFEDRVLELRPGDFINIPAHHRHRVAWTTPDEPTIWLAVHYRDES